MQPVGLGTSVGLHLSTPESQGGEGVDRGRARSEAGVLAVRPGQGKGLTGTLSYSIPAYTSQREELTHGLRKHLLSMLL